MGNPRKASKLMQFSRKVKAFRQKHLDDLVLLAGCGCVVYGVSFLSIPGAWITAGVLLIAMAIMVGLGGKK